MPAAPLWTGNTQQLSGLPLTQCPSPFGGQDNVVFLAVSQKPSCRPGDAGDGIAQGRGERVWWVWGTEFTSERTRWDGAAATGHPPCQDLSGPGKDKVNET